MADMTISLASVAPLHRSQIPVGTLAEASERGLDPGVYATCARENKAAGIKGCAWCDSCVVSARATAGPKNYGIQIIKGQAVGGGFVRNTVDCMWIADHHADIVRNGGSLKVIAEEGESYDKVASIAKDNATGAQTMNSRLLNTYREEDRVSVTVKPWPRPGQNKELLQDMMRAEVAQEERERLEHESVARSLGIEGAAVPLDKRAARKDAGPGASGGGKSGA